MMAICGGRGRIIDKVYLHHIYCKVKNQMQGENQVIQSDQDVHMYGCDEYGKVYTRSGMGARHYHIYMMNVVVMVRWTLGPEWVLVITIKFI
jgi:hypothetical protein